MPGQLLPAVANGQLLHRAYSAVANGQLPHRAYSAQQLLSDPLVGEEMCLLWQPALAGGAM